MAGEPGEITGLLAKIGSGEAEASTRLISLVYRELRAIAGRCMQRERSDHTLQPTVLVHEAYLRLASKSGVQWQSRAQFYGFAAQIMRRVLLDYARERRALKRGGAAAHISLDDAFLVAEDQLEKVLMLDESLQRLAAVDPQQNRIVELRFFAGMTLEETSQVMGISTATIKREWSHAKAWLHRDMSARGANAAGQS
jgi:RNA polymerase sigma factor (TIGR02999 family)